MLRQISFAELFQNLLGSVFDFMMIVTNGYAVYYSEIILEYVRKDF